MTWLAIISSGIPIAFGVLSPGTPRVSDNATKHALILAGVGWGSLPLWSVERDLAEGGLVRVAAAEFGRQGETFVRAYLAAGVTPARTLVAVYKVA
jgi:DNA-binding transcriptional LysR family regulator